MRIIHETLQYPFSTSPEFGTTMQVAPGVYWLRMPLPMSLNHINLYLIEGNKGWTIVELEKINEDMLVDVLKHLYKIRELYEKKYERNSIFQKETFQTINSKDNLPTFAMLKAFE